MTRYTRLHLLTLTILCAGCAANGGDETAVNAVDNNLTTIEQAMRAEQQTVESRLTAAKNNITSQSSLPAVLVSQLDVSQQQALGGAGAIFRAAKKNMEPQAFATLSQAVPGMGDMLSAAPTISNPVSTITDDVSSVISGADNTLQNMASLASSFKQLNLSPDMISQFIPIVTNYVRVKGGQSMAGLLQAALR